MIYALTFIIMFINISMANKELKLILNSILHEREYYCVSVRPIALLHSLIRSSNNVTMQYRVQYGFNYVINLLLLLYYFKPMKVYILITVY